MKKEYHYTISRTDRICLVTFVMILLAWELVKGFFPGEKQSYEYAPRESEFDNGYRSGYTNYQQRDFSKKYKSNSFSNKYAHKPYQNNNAKQSPPPHPLPIMTASINELTSMGLSVKVAFNIQKFISAGGTLESPEDLMKIYGMDSLQLINASPYIVFAPPEVNLEKEFTKNDYKPSSKSTIIDLNTATVLDLESLHGIGIVLAERIIKFRESLGGFIHPDQLKDCYGITPELYDQLKPQLQISASFKKIKINHDDLSTLTHPYLSKKMLRLITAFRDHHGPFTAANELKKVYPHDSTWFNKILPYISFEIDENKNEH